MASIEDSNHSQDILIRHKIFNSSKADQQKVAPCFSGSLQLKDIWSTTSGYMAYEA